MTFDLYHHQDGEGLSGQNEKKTLTDDEVSDEILDDEILDDETLDDETLDDKQTTLHIPSHLTLMGELEWVIYQLSIEHMLQIHQTLQKKVIHSSDDILLKTEVLKYIFHIKLLVMHSTMLTERKILTLLDII